MTPRADLDGFKYKADQDFFAAPWIKQLVSKIADEPRLTIFLGAGASVAQGLPTWNELLLRMLITTSKTDDRFDGDDQRDAWARLILRSYDPTAAASVLRARYPQPRTFGARLHDALYQPSSDAHVQERGSDRFCRAVWDLVLRRHKVGKQTTLVTLNFDDTIERGFAKASEIRAAAAAIGIASVSPVYSRRTLELADSDGDVFPVIHLHGYLPKAEADWEDQKSAEYVLSATDFAGAWTEHWTHEVLQRCIDDKWLMVGMSFQDAHINSLLRRRQASFPDKPKNPVGIVSTQGRPWHDLPRSTVELLAEAEQTRLTELGLLPLITSYFFQDYLFLQEVANQSAASGIEHYAERRAHWHEEFLAKRGSLGRSQADKCGRKVRDHLEDLRKAIESSLPAAGQAERIKTELWLRDLDERGLRLFASSEGQLADRARAPVFPLDADSTVAAVKALTHGAPRTHDREPSQPGIWRSYAAFPLHLAGEPWWDLPVGTLVAASTLPLKASIFSTEGLDVSDLVHEHSPPIISAVTPKLGLSGLAARVIP